MERVQLTFFLPRLLSTPEQKLKYMAVSVTLSQYNIAGKVKEELRKVFFNNIKLNNFLPAKKR